MTNKLKTTHIIREVDYDSQDFSHFFDSDGFTSNTHFKTITPEYSTYTATLPDGTKETHTYEKSPYNYNLFIICNTRNAGSFNREEFDSLFGYIEELAEHYDDITNGSGYAVYSSVGAMLLDLGYIDSIKQTNRIKKWKAFLADYMDDTMIDGCELIAAFLSLVRGEQWCVISATGYNQGDYVDIVYCEGSYENPRIYGEVWLGAATEFCVEDVETEDVCYGFVIADCQSYHDGDTVKQLVCDWAGIPIETTELHLIDGSTTITNYTYRVV